MTILLIIECIIGVLAVCLFIGYMLPMKHTAVIEAGLAATPDQAWKQITSVENYPQWRKELKQVEKISDTQWIEHDKHHKTPYRVLETLPGQKWVIVIDTKKLAYGGTWTFELQPEGNGTKLRITEAGEIYNPFFRFMAKCFLGYEMTLKKYVTNLKGQA